MDKLNVIIVYYNFMKYQRRKQLTIEFIERMLKYDKINLYIVELILDGDDFEITDGFNKNHLQIKTNYILWFKENLINIAVDKLLDIDWKNFAWMDSDIMFENNDWIDNVLNELNNYDIIQLFSKAYQLDINNNITSYSYGCIKYNMNRNKYIIDDQHTHPGYAWAISKNGYNKIIKLPDMFIVGGADSRIAYGILNIDLYISNYEEENIYFCEEFKKYIIEYQNKISMLSFSYIECNIYHFYHGNIKNRQYFNRHKLLSEYNYNPFTDLKYNKDGLIEPTNNFSTDLLCCIKKYFYNRKEDD